MSAQAVSVIIVSRGRAALLRRCLTGVGQLFHPNFEIVVVADRAGGQVVRQMGWEGRVKLVPFDQANISAARNAGLRVAAGEVVAFIDDDAVPEPTWLSYLAAPFADPAIGAAGGFVRGRNGISFQFRAALVSPTGEEVPLEVSSDAAFSPEPPPGFAVKTMGTNSAFRRSNVSLIGGLDPVFRFFHDETDLNMRLARDGVRTAVVPLAQVHHGYAASERRAPDRAPKSLFEIGASSMVFLRKHAPAEVVEPALERLREAQRVRLLKHMISGGLEPHMVEYLRSDLEAGLREGRARRIIDLAPIGPATEAFLRFERSGASGRSVCLAGRTWSRKRLHQQAMQHLREGDVVTVYRFSPTALFHHVQFREEGYWLQRGGIFGRASRDEALFQRTSFRARVEREGARVAKLRQNDEKLSTDGDAPPPTE